MSDLRDRRDVIIVFVANTDDELTRVTSTHITGVRRYDFSRLLLLFFFFVISIFLIIRAVA